jgi:hypothetical protein
MSSPILAAALAYAGRGLAVFPVPPDSKKSYLSEKYSNGRKWGASADPADVQRNFARWPNARIGIPTGADNGLVVVETDTIAGHGVDGANALAELETFYDALSECGDRPLDGGPGQGVQFARRSRIPGAPRVKSMGKRSSRDRGAAWH